MFFVVLWGSIPKKTAKPRCNKGEVTRMKSRRNIAVRQLFLSLMITFLIVASLQAAGNLLTNPGFEDGTTGWNSRGGCTLSTSTVSRSGSYSGYSTGRSSYWQGIKQSMLDKMQPGETYSISGWVMLENSSSDEIAVTFEQEDGSGTHYIRVDTATGSNSSWTRLSGQFTLDVVGTLITLDLYFEGPAAGVNFYLDDAEVLGDGVEPPDANAVGMVEIGIVYQELEGFGASGAWYTNWLLAHPLKNEIYDVLFGQLGLDIYRLRNTYDQGPGGASYIDDSAEIVTAAEDSLGYPVKIMISSWSPPDYLKSDANLAGGTLKKDIYGDYMYDEFADWWADSLDEFSSHGINADYINIQNEPNWVASWDTCLLDPSESATVAGYNESFEAVWQKLNTEMGSAMPKMLAAEARNISLSGNYLDNLINDSHVYGYAHHLYGDGSGNNPDAYIPAMTSFASQYGDRPLMQTEYEDSTGAWPDALKLALLMHNSLTVEEVSVYLYWDLFWGSSGGLVTLPSYGSSSYTINSDYYGFKHFSAFIDSGWHRVEASTDSNALRISAFKNADDTELSIVIINVSDVCINLALSLEDFSPGTSSVYRTSESENAAYIGTFDESQSIELPPQTITTVSLTGSYTPDFSNCGEVLAAGYGLASDISDDCYVNYIDLEIMTNYWLATNCGDLNNCGGADFEPDGDVDFIDLGTFLLQWLQCNDPQDPSCSPNW